MDELVCPASSSSSPSPTSLSAAGHLPAELEFVSWDVPEEWMDGSNNNDWFHEPLDHGDDGSRSVGHNNDLSAGFADEPPPPPAPKRRGRKPGPRPARGGGGPAVSHVEAERQRRDKLNRGFCELRAAVPTVSRMDRASLLADAASYIADLRRRVGELEAKAKAKQQQAAATHSFTGGGVLVQQDTKQLGLEVRMLGGRGGLDAAAALRLTTATAAARHAPAHLMVALRALDLPVQHACMCRVGGVTVQDAVVDVPAAAGLRDERCLRAALLHRLQLQQSGCYAG